MKKTLILMDVDGTIAESTQKINPEIRGLLCNLDKDRYELGIVGGSQYEKIKVQLDNLELTHIFAENGCVYYKNNVLEISQDIRQNYLFPKMNKLVKHALQYLSKVEYNVTGQLIDLRKGIIYISLIGGQATLAERQDFIKLDKVKNIRATLLEELKELAKTLQIDDQIDILMGGSVGIGIHPHEWDKVQVVDLLDFSSFEEVHYLGDKYSQDGNDYRLLNHKDVIKHEIDSLTDTVDFFTSLLTVL